MAGKSKIARTPAALQPGASIPLADIEITWQRPCHFIGEKGAQPVTIRGKDLAIILDWMGRAAPGRPTEFESPEHVADIVDGLGELARVAAASDDYPDHRLILWTLGQVIEDYGHRVLSRERAGDAAMTAVVRIASKASTAVA